MLLKCKKTISYSRTGILNSGFPISIFSIYQVHDDLKDKDFKLELSWVCDRSGGQHQLVPRDLYNTANEAGKSVKDTGSSDEEA